MSVTDEGRNEITDRTEHTMIVPFIVLDDFMIIGASVGVYNDDEL